MSGTGHRLQPKILQTISDCIDAGKIDSATLVITGDDLKCIAKLRKDLKYWGYLIRRLQWYKAGL